MLTYTDRRKEIKALSKQLFKKYYTTNEYDTSKIRYLQMPNYRQALRPQRKMMARRAALMKVRRGA